MPYATWSNGYRSGGFIAAFRLLQPRRSRPTTRRPWRATSSVSRATWLDNMLRLNGNVFFMDYKDKQEETPPARHAERHRPEDCGGERFDGAKSAVWSWKCRPSRPMACTCARTWLTSIPGLRRFSSIDGKAGRGHFSNLEFRRAPEWTGNIDATYEWKTSANTNVGACRLPLSRRAPDQLHNSPELTNDAQHLVDASINYDFGRTRLSLFGRNLTEEDGYMIGYDVAASGPTRLRVRRAPGASRWHTVLASSNLIDGAALLAPLRSE